MCGPGPSLADPLRPAWRGWPPLQPERVNVTTSPQVTARDPRTSTGHRRRKPTRIGGTIAATRWPRKKKHSCTQLWQMTRIRQKQNPRRSFRVPLLSANQRFHGMPSRHSTSATSSGACQKTSWSPSRYQSEALPRCRQCQSAACAALGQLP